MDILLTVILAIIMSFIMIFLIFTITTVVFTSKNNKKLYLFLYKYNDINSCSSFIYHEKTKLYTYDTRILMGIVFLYQNRIEEYVVYFEQLMLNRKFKAMYMNSAEAYYEVAKFILNFDYEYKHNCKQLGKKNNIEHIIKINKEIDKIKQKEKININIFIKNLEIENCIPLIMLSYLIIKAVGEEEKLELSERNKNIIETYKNEEIYVKLYERLKAYNIKK